MREWIADGRVGEKKLVGVGDPIGAAVEIVTDPPDKGRMPAQPLVGVAAAVRRLGDQAEHEFVLVSPYFVPGKDGARWLMDMAARCVAVSVLTNSLDATDVPVVHGGYSRYRKRLLRAGVIIHELKPTGAASRIRRFLGGYSRSSLHTKAVVVDGRYALIGSYNFDPRSTWINTEMAVLIEDPGFAASVLADFQQALDPLHSYRLSLRRNRLIWTDIEDGQKRVQDREPAASAKRRMQAALARMLPIESQL
jgi:putative cardiolipin synthase